MRQDYDQRRQVVYAEIALFLELLFPLSRSLFGIPTVEDGLGSSLGEFDSEDEVAVAV